MDRRIGLGRLAVVILGLVVGGVGGSAEARQSAGGRESWDAIYVGGKRVGYFHTSVTPLQERGKSYVRVQVDMALTFRRGRDLVTIDTLYGTIETPDGEVLRLDSRTAASKTETRIFGDVRDGKMTLTLEGTGEKQTQTIDWGPHVRGPYGAEMSMARRPMQPGESREISIFIPDLNRIGLAKLQAQQREVITLGGGVKRELLRVAQSTWHDGKPVPGMDQTLWVDETGQILKSHLDILGGMDTYRTTK
ncbi:MAG: hypothetical protein SFX72_07730 [Isosphaeraceae bacterium]|nr:hypothetical protein [Isosphaeraceae bacterium]